MGPTTPTIAQRWPARLHCWASVGPALGQRWPVVFSGIGQNRTVTSGGSTRIGGLEYSTDIDIHFYS